MGEASKISLKAIGKQDTYLLSKDQDLQSLGSIIEFIILLIMETFLDGHLLKL
jgi:hypothetical protein